MEKIKINQSIAIVLLLFSALNTHAQRESDQTQYHLGITLFDEHVATPFGAKSDSPTHLGGTISFEISKRRGGVFQFTHIFQAGYYYHQDFNQVAFLAWKPKFELRFANTFNVNAIPGIGYAHSFPTQTTYRLNGEVYNQETNWGKSHVMPSIGFGAGLHLNKLLDLPIELFGRYEMFGLAPYSPKGSIPLTLNTMTSFGIKYTFN